MGILTRLKHGYDAFMGRDPTEEKPKFIQNTYYGSGYGYRPNRSLRNIGNERSIVTAVYNKIAVDAASMDLKHVFTDENGSYMDDKQSQLNYCLTCEANIDQTGRALIQDAVYSMLEEGVVAIVPTVTVTYPKNPGAFDIQELRTAKILQWHPQSVTVDIYNPHSGKHEQLTFDKRFVAIIENPFFAVMNEPNSTLKRLTRKLSLLDNIDEQNGAGKLDLIIQLPYVIKTDTRRTQAENRRKDIEQQLAGSKYGIAYTDGTERITQLNRPIANTLPDQVKELRTQFYAQLSITQAVMNGTANEAEMQNYYTRTIEPIVSAITDELTRKFLTKTARSQHQRISFFRDVFELVPVSVLSDIADRFTRNEILTSNEVRAIIGYRPVNTEEANSLSNKNIKEPGTLPNPELEGGEQVDMGEDQAAYEDPNAAGADAGGVEM